MSDPPPPSPPDSLYSSGADEAADVAARLAEDAAGLPARTREDTTLSCAACFARVAPRAQPHAHGRGLFRTVYLVDGAVRVEGSVEVRERGPVAGKRGRDEVESGVMVAGATTTVPALVCAACGADIGAVHDDVHDGVPVYTLWDVLPGE